MIKVDGLCKSFGELRVLVDVSIGINKGDILCFIGPSGSGKSTLLRCINGIERPEKGSIVIDDVDMLHHRTNLDHMRAKVGFVFQNFNLFPHMTAVDNIMLAPLRVLKQPEDRARKDAISLLARVGLSDKVNAYPAQLSGGQRQRVAIARALAMNPDYMLFDEPTSALDPEMIGEVLEVIRSLAKTGMTMAIVTHEMSFAREIATSVVFMDEGRIVEQAKPDDFFTSPRNPRTIEFISKIL